MPDQATIKVSDDQGATWVTLRDDIDGFFLAGIQDTTGRIWTFYYYDDGEEVGPAIYYIYSDDQGQTWSDDESIPEEQRGPHQVDLGEVIPAEGKIGLDIDSTGRLWISFWDSEDNVKTAYTDFQKDAEGNYIWTVGDIT